MSFNSIWYGKPSLMIALLLPFSWIFRGIVAFRRFLYRKKVLKTHFFSVPVIVVGNITVGGTGKTPCVIALATLLQAQGFKPGIVSRGYRSKQTCFPHLLTLKDDANQVGDEPYLMFRETTCPVVIDKNRVRAVQFLLKKTQCDIVLSDDGLQHYALGRNLEILVVDGDRLFGNKHLLPAGPLREPIKRLEEADFVLFNGGNSENNYRMDYHYGDLHSLIDSSITQTVEDFRGTSIHAVAGIGNPNRFFLKLSEKGFHVIAHPFPDHYEYEEADIFFDDELPVVMTEKDAVKCLKYANFQHWSLPVKAELSEAFKETFLAQFAKILTKTN